MNNETRRGVRAASAAIGLTALSILSVAAIHTSLQQQSMGGLMAPLGGGATITHAPPLATMQMGKTVVENPGLVAPGAATTTTTAAGH